jgi:hypothetical protein
MEELIRIAERMALASAGTFMLWLIYEGFLKPVSPGVK